MIKLRKFSTIAVLVFFVCVVSGCATTSKKAFEVNESQLKTRSMQTRAFDTTDKKKMMQTVISTMQDLDFVIDKADLLLGSVTGTKFTKNMNVAMTVTVRERGEKQLLVRCNAQYGITTIEDPVTYQDFFNVLGKALFLTAQQVD